MRFNDPGHLAAWRANGTFPAIHQPMFVAAVEYLPDAPVLDLCASTGLLGRRVRDHLGLPVVAIEADRIAVQNGYTSGAYGEDLRVLRVSVGPDTYDHIRDFLIEYGVRSVLARRCVPELANSGADPADVGRLLEEAGVTTVVLEGHKVSSRVTDPLVPADAQADALLAGLGEHWRVAYRNGDIRVLCRR